MLGHSCRRIATVACLSVLPILCAASAAIGARQCVHVAQGSSECAEVSHASDHSLISKKLIRHRSKANWASSAAGAGSSREEGVAALKAYVMAQVEKALLTSNHSVPDETLASLRALKDYLQTVQADILKLHASDQNDIDDALDLIRGCTDDDAGDSNGEEDAKPLGLDALSSSVEDHRNRHKVCRLQQAAMLDNKNAKCEDYARARKSDRFASAPPTCSLAEVASDSPSAREAFDECLRTTYMWTAGLWASHEACHAAQEQHRNQTAKCNLLQEQFESSACRLATMQGGVCRCQKRAADHFEARRTNVSESESVRQHMYESALRMACFIDALVSGGTHEDTTLEHCKELTIDKSHLVINYGSVHDPEEGCSSAPPCSSSWLSKEYETMSWHSKAPAAECARCETMAAGTPAPTPRPSAAPSIGTEIYNTAFGFMALNKNTGKGRCWGDVLGGGVCDGFDFTGVTDVYSNSRVFMALNKNTGKAQCWGESRKFMNYGADCSEMDFSGVTDVYTGFSAFMALDKKTGKAQCWGGKSGYGGKCSGMDFAGVTDVFSNEFTFLALNKNSHKAQCWGGNMEWLDYSGDCSSIDFSEFTDVYSSSGAWVVFNRNTKKGRCWGKSDRGGDCSGVDFSGVTDVYSAGNGFMALNKNTGKAQCWGASETGIASCGGMDFSGVTDVYSSYSAFMALNKKTGKAQCWGHSRISCSGIDFSGVTDVYSSRKGGGFLALNKNSGKAHCWGGGPCSGDSIELDFSGVTDVYMNGYVVVALNKQTGQATCLGTSSYGGGCTGEDFSLLS
mmetsp:Transcript_102504/g.256835  ORF Transcript_102504/g.256835 Transcript_102504/m.256835 type:complete len:795 (+) Transcript_102504:82-2466(+)